MQFAIIVVGVIVILILAWFLAVELEPVIFGRKKKTEEPAIGTLDEVIESPKAPSRLENFSQWAGPRLPVTAGRIGFTILWAAFLLSLFDHLASRSGFTGSLVYYLVILPHEAGHFLCSPFGWFLSVAGGSIWQIFLFTAFGFIVLFRKRRNEALGWWAVVGHSLINLSTYIADASARSLPLIPFLVPDASRHDWGLMLEYLGLLEYDWLIAQTAIVIGGAIILSAVVVGLFITWYQPQKLLK